MMEIEVTVTVSCDADGCWSQYEHAVENPNRGEDQMYEEAAEAAQKTGWFCDNFDTVQDFCPEHK